MDKAAELDDLPPKREREREGGRPGVIGLGFTERHLHDLKRRKVPESLPVGKFQLLNHLNM